MKRTPQDEEELKLSITPLIDVTFLLLIFFMVTLKFKTLEEKVAAYLPKDRGPKNLLIPPPDETKIAVVLKRSPGETLTRVKLLDSEIGTGAAGFTELDRRIAAIHRRDPKIPGEIDAWADVPHGHVVRAIDAFMKAGVTEITFVGTKPPGR